MSFTYKKVAIDPKIGKEVSVIRSDGWCIPFDRANTMYQEYLEWVAAGNTAEAADGLTWNDIRSERDDILRQTDWTMTTGATFL